VNPDDVRLTTAHAYDQIVDEFVRRTNDINADLIEFRSNFVSAVVAHGCVVDVGCGPGRDAVYFDSAGLRVVGLDASTEMARRARSEGVRMVLADIRVTPIRQGSLDGIWSAASLLHVPRGDVPATLRAWRSLLAPRGVLGLSTSLGAEEGWEACPYDPTKQHDPVGLRRWFVHHDEHELTRLIEAAGFAILDSRERVSNRRWLQLLARKDRAP
jgi:SAM-dependent methyltransferase